MAGENVGSVNVAFTADYSDLDRGSQQAAAIVQQASADMGGGLREATAAVQALTAALQQQIRLPDPSPARRKGHAEEKQGLAALLEKGVEFRREQTQQARTARFFTNELGSVIPVAGEAKGAMQGLLGVLVEGAAGGLSFGLALEVAKYAAEAFHGAMTRAENTAKEWAAMQATHAREVADAFEDLHRRLGYATLESSKVLQQAADKWRDEVRKLDDEARDDEHMGAWSKWWSAMLPGDDYIQRAERRAARLKQIQQEVANLPNTPEARTAKQIEVWELERRMTNDLRLLRAQAASEEVRVRAEAAAKIKKLHDDTPKEVRQTKVYADMKAQIEANAEAQIAAMKRQHALATSQFLRQQAMVGVNDRQRIQMEAEQALEALEAQRAAARAQRDDEQVVRVGRMIAALKKASALRLAIYDADLAAANARQAQQVEEATTAQAVATAEKLAAARTQARAYARAGYDMERADRLASLQQQERAELDHLSTLHDSGLLAWEVYEQRVDAVRSKYRTAALVEQQTFATQFADTLATTWQQGMQRMMEGTLSFKDGIRGIWQTVRASFAQTAASMLGTWLKTMALKVATAEWAAVKIQLVEAWAATKRVAIAVWEGLKWIAIQGWKAAAAGYAAIASIPIVGPFLAPVVAAGLLAAVIGLGSKLASARGGYDIPAGVNPLVQAHAEEMILPAKYANAIRDMANGGQAGQAGPVSVNLTVQAWDGADVERVLSQNDGALIRVLQQALRDGRMRPQGV